MLRTIRNGLGAGALAGFLAAFLFIIDYGPANSLRRVANWFRLDSPGAGKLVGLLLMLLLGALFGVLFSVVIGKQQPALGRTLIIGLLTGAAWWIVIVFVLGTLINHLPLDFGSWLFSFVPLLVYGLLLGSISFQWRQHA